MGKILRIGLDFDNTIARYGKLFEKIAIQEKIIKAKIKINNKDIIRKQILKQKNGKHKWMRLQGLVYGKYMKNADLYPGLVNFLYACKLRECEIFIVSHKTEHGHFDKDKISLRKQALKWMKSKDFFDTSLININIKNIFFANTQDQKIEFISDLKLDYFIDDLPEILSHKKFPKKTKKILFDESFKTKFSVNDIETFNNWTSIFYKFFGHVKSSDIKLWLESIGFKKIIQISKIKAGANSSVFRITVEKNKYKILKFYPDLLIDCRERLKTEYKAFNFLKKNAFSEIPKVIKKSDDLNIGIYEWIKGKKINKYNFQDLKFLIKFVLKLKNLSKKTHKNTFNNASEACLSIKELISQIDKRINNLENISPQNKSLSLFLNSSLKPFWRIIKKRSIKKIIINNLEKDIAKKYQILSPSDISLQNMVKYKKVIKYLDFEYFGWDDPVKLVSDFTWHPSVNLNRSLILKWYSAMVDIFSDDKDFCKRFSISHSLYGIRWILILLNEFNLNSIKKIKNVSRQDKNLNLLKQKYQLKKAKKMFNFIYKQSKFNYNLF